MGGENLRDEILEVALEQWTERQNIQAERLTRREKTEQVVRQDLFSRLQRFSRVTGKRYRIGKADAEAARRGLNESGRREFPYRQSAERTL